MNAAPTLKVTMVFPSNMNAMLFGVLSGHSVSHNNDCPTPVSNIVPQPPPAAPSKVMKALRRLVVGIAI
ncbi:unnamed protein product [Rodentolepis nana]|uniref:Secreted protein n=1 Tax=Rodentolepis nana TaxID=102285 RepID=A0A0R3T2R3_RODNA|nr:unnamed protein product [Rodentolepis nana]